jgi:hypothetical protein
MPSRTYAVQKIQHHSGNGISFLVSGISFVSHEERTYVTPNIIFLGCLDRYGNITHKIYTFLYWALCKFSFHDWLTVARWALLKSIKQEFLVVSWLVVLVDLCSFREIFVVFTIFWVFVFACAEMAESVQRWQVLLIQPPMQAASTNVNSGHLVCNLQKIFCVWDGETRFVLQTSSWAISSCFFVGSF